MKILITALLAALLMTSILIGSSCQPDRITPAQIAQKKAAQKKLDEHNKPPAETTPKQSITPPIQTAPPVLKQESLTTLKTSVIPTTSPSKEAPDTFYVKMETSEGDILIECNKSFAPIGTQHFYDLINAGYYNECRFFRVVPGFVVQFGLAADPAVTENYGKSIMDEPVKASNTAGTLTFAKSGAPNSRTTQMFINLNNNSRLDGMGFSPFGEIIEGMENVSKIFSGYGERPDQGLITMQGNAYLTKAFPKLSYIKKAYIVTIEENPSAEAETAEPAPEASGSENKEQ